MTADARRLVTQPRTEKANAMPSTASSIHRETIERELGVDVANAIDGRIDEKIAARIGELRTETEQLINEQRRIVSDTRALPPEQRQQVAPAVNASNSSVITATDRYNDLQERRQRGENIDQAEIDQAEQEMMAAREQQAVADGEVTRAQRETPARPAVTRPSTTSTTRTSTQRAHSGSTVLPTPSSSLEQRVTTLENQGRDRDSILLSSYGMARRLNSSADAGAKAAKAGLATFVVVFLVYCLIIMLTPINWDWSNALGIPAIMAGIVAALVWLQGSSDNQSEILTMDQARADNDQYSSRRQNLLNQQERQQAHEDDRYDDEHSSSRGGLRSMMSRS